MPPDNQAYPQSPSNNDAKQKRLLMIVGIMLLLIAVFAGLNLLLSSGNESDPTQQLSLVLARQHQLTNIIDEVKTSAASDDTKASISRAKILLSSDALSLEDLGYSSGKNQAGSLDIKNTVATLEEASQNNRFDEAFSDLLKTEVSTLETTVADIAGQTTDSSLKTVLKQMVANYQSLL